MEPLSLFCGHPDRVRVDGTNQPEQHQPFEGVQICKIFDVEIVNLEICADCGKVLRGVATVTETQPQQQPPPQQTLPLCDCDRQEMRGVHGILHRCQNCDGYYPKPNPKPKTAMESETDTPPPQQEPLTLYWARLAAQRAEEYDGAAKAMNADPPHPTSPNSKPSTWAQMAARDFRQIARLAESQPPQQEPVNPLAQALQEHIAEGRPWYISVFGGSEDVAAAVAELLHHQERHIMRVLAEAEQTSQLLFDKAAARDQKADISHYGGRLWLVSHLRQRLGGGMGDAPDPD